MREKIIMIFAYSLESIFQIITTDSFTVGLGWFLDNRFYTRDTSNCLVGSWKRYLEREISVSHYLFYILEFYLLISVVPIGDLFWLFVARFSVLVEGSLVSSLTIVKLFLWFGRPMIFTLALRGFSRLQIVSLFYPYIDEFISAAYYFVIEFVIVLAYFPHQRQVEGEGERQCGSWPWGSLVSKVFLAVGLGSVSYRWSSSASIASN